MNVIQTILQLPMLRDSPLFDGTISELSSTFYIDNLYEDARYADLIEEFGESGLKYIEMKVKEFITRDIENYASIVADPEGWRNFDDNIMDKYFNDYIRMFPFAPKPDRARSEAAAGADTGRERRGFLGLGSRAKPRQRLENPQAFHLVQKQMIERRFAGGNVNDIGERDIRDAISCLRYVFIRNFWRLVMSRRSVVFLSMLLILTAVVGFSGAAIFVSLNPALSETTRVMTLGAATALALTTFAASWIWARHMIKRNSQEYKKAIQATCNALARGLETRINNIIMTIPLIFHKIDKIKMEMRGEGKLEHWPQEVKKWSKLAFWLDARVEHIELYMQVQMWRIRRMHYGMRWIGAGLSWVLGLVALLPLIAAGALIFAWPGLLSHPLAWAVGAAGAVGALLALDLAGRSYFMDTPDVDIIERTLKTDNMKRYRDVGLHVQFADFSFQEKSHHLHEEDKLKR